ncbi:MAG TPA: NUDIX hydrolase [Rhabdochlamydiaceae bacterium]|nr:NUDIX hydrolase [Rhabdochlamydiaceae bacterium]
MSKSKLQYQLEKKAKTQSEFVYKGKILSLRRDHFQLQEGAPQQYDIVVHPGAVAVIPVTDQGNLLLIKQWRRAAQKILIEIPAGILEKNEDPLECAKRELQEETGYKAELFISLGGFFTTPGYCTEYIYLYIAKQLSPSYLPPDDHEWIDPFEVSLESALEMVYEHEIEDVKTIAAILQYSQWQTNEAKK